MATGKDKSPSAVQYSTEFLWKSCSATNAPTILGKTLTCSRRRVLGSAYESAIHFIRRPQLALHTTLEHSFAGFVLHNTLQAQQLADLIPGWKLVIRESILGHEHEAQER